jgi:Interferon-induced transmembrane protein
MSHSMPAPLPGRRSQPDQTTAESRMPGDCHQHSMSQAPGPQPPDDRAWAIAATLAGVLFSVIIGAPAGMVAFYYSRRVRRGWEAGDQQAADAASRAARGWAIASTCLDVAGLIVVSVIISRGGSPVGWM